MFVELEEKNKLASDQGLLNILRLIEVALSDPQVAADYQLATHLNKGAAAVKNGYLDSQCRNDYQQAINYFLMVNGFKVSPALIQLMSL